MDDRSEGDVCVAAEAFADAEDDANAMITEGAKGVRIQIIPYTTTNSSESSSDRGSSSSSSSSSMHKSLGLGPELGPGLGPAPGLGSFPGLSALRGALAELTTTHGSQPSILWVDVDVASGTGCAVREGCAVTDAGMMGVDAMEDGHIGDGNDNYNRGGGEDGDGVRLPLSVVDLALGQLYEAAEANTVMMVVTQADIAPLTQVSTHPVNPP